MAAERIAQASMPSLYLQNLNAHDSKYAERTVKADKIREVLRDYLGTEQTSYICLDVGCATGTLSRQLSSEFQFCVGIDVEAALLAQINDQGGTNLAFAQADGSQAPFQDGKFDVVMCAQVYEHAEDPQKLADEIWRVLRPGGICFFSGPNKWTIVEEHYWLPFLSWLPTPLSAAYMQLFGRGKYYDVRPFSYWRLHDLWHDFLVEDYTLHMIREPERFSLRDRMGRLHWIKHIPRWILRPMLPFVPNFNWILVKPKKSYADDE